MLFNIFSYYGTSLSQRLFSEGCETKHSNFCLENKSQSSQNNIFSIYFTKFKPYKSWEYHHEFSKCLWTMEIHQDLQMTRRKIEKMIFLFWKQKSKLFQLFIFPIFFCFQTFYVNFSHLRCQIWRIITHKWSGWYLKKWKIWRLSSSKESKSKLTSQIWQIFRPLLTDQVSFNHEVFHFNIISMRRSVRK